MDRSELRTGARLVVAVDFGTTFTGIAWMEVRHGQTPKFEDVKVHDEWPRLKSTKVPSVISYSATPSGRTQWGHDLEPGSQVMRWMKLELHTRGRSSQLRQLADVVKGLRLIAKFRADANSGANNDVPEHLTLSAEEVISDLLARIVRKWYESREGENSVLLTTAPLDLIITHPGEWPYAARNKTVRAVLSAFPTAIFPKRRCISLCSEPEASALYTLLSSTHKLRARLLPGDCFIICDAGGGTVDFVACEMRSKTPFDVSFISPPTSLHCGATSLDRNFFAWMRRIIGKFDESADVGVGGHYVLGPVAEALLDGFMNIKHSFDDEDVGLLQLPAECLPKVLPDRFAQERVSHGELKMTREDLEEIFDPVVNEITTGIAKKAVLPQVQGAVSGRHRRVTHVFITGGFSENPYLFSKVEEWARLKTIQVERGDDPWGAVVRGAVLKAAGVGASLPDLVTICPRSYGIICSQRYAAHLDHEEADLENDKLTGKTMASNQILWKVCKGDFILPSEPISLDTELNVSFTNREEQAGHGARISFVASEEDQVPSQLPPDGHSLEIIELEFTFSKIPDSGRTKVKRADWKHLKCFKATIKVTIEVDKRVKIKVESGGTELVEKDTAL